MTGRKRKFEELLIKRVPPWKRFTVTLFRNRGGWAVRITAGIVWLSFRKNYTYDLRYWDAETGIEFGPMQWKLHYGDRMPEWRRWMKVTRRFSEPQP